MVIFLFLRTLSATIIPSVAVPLSLVGTFGVMYLLGYSLDNLSLMALTISTGFVVDDAIVMIENIDRYIEEGHTPLEAALRGAGQIGFTIVSLTVSLIAVLIPLLFMGDIVGRLFREFAVTLASPSCSRPSISLTLTPMMCSLLLRHERPRRSTARFYEWSERAFNNTIAFYGRTVKFVLKHQTADAAGHHRHAGRHHLPLHRRAQGLLPGAGHRRDHWAFPTRPRASRSRPCRSSNRQLAAAILKDKDVESLSSFIGVDGTNTTPNSGRIQINLKSRDERSDDVTSHHEAAAAGGQPASRASRCTCSRCRTSRSKTASAARNISSAWKMPIRRSCASVDGQAGGQAEDPAASCATSPPTSRTRRRRRTWSSIATPLRVLGVTTSAIDNTLYDAFGQRLVSIMFTQLNQYHVVLEVDPQFPRDPDSLKSIYVPAVADKVRQPRRAAATGQQSGSGCSGATATRCR